MNHKLCSRLLTALLMLCLFASLTACGEGETQTTEPISYSLTLDQTELTLAEDTEAVLTATVQPESPVKWSTSDESVLSVSGGKLLAKKPGNATVTAAVGETTAACKVTVTASDGSFLYLEPDKAFYPVEIGGEGVQVAFTLYQVAADGTKTQLPDSNITYTLENEKLAQLEGDTLTGLIGGTTNVVATSGSYVGSAQVRIYDMFVSDTAEWNKMLSSRTLGAYFMLDGDIDFAGKTYTGMNTGAPASVKSQSFRGTLDGNGHTVKNVRLSGGYSSLFGQLYSATIRNVHFENVELSSGSGLATSISGQNTLVENISLDLHITGSGYALFNTAYGGTLQNVVVTVNAGGPVSTIGSVYGLETSAVYVLAESGIKAIPQVYGYTTKMEMVAAVNSQKLLPVASWNYFGGSQLPELTEN